jgi:DNA-binding ferritin-like protein (Dps family)
MGTSEFSSKVIGDKRRWRQYKARTRAFPEGYRTTVEGI